MVNLEGSQNLIKTPDFTTATYLEVLILEGCTRLAHVHPSIGVLKSLKLLNLRGCRSLSSLPTKIGMESLETLILSGCSNLVRFPEIDGKMECSSLRELNLRDRNLREGDIPNDISCLSSLKKLDLSDCKELKSVPELLTSIEDVRLDGCSSLEVVELANPLDVTNLVGSTFMKAVNCYRLAENINALTLLKKHLKAFSNSRKTFDIFMPGSEIPEWFSQQTSDSPINIPLPINLQKDSQWIGVACCCIFVINDASRDDKQDIGCKAGIYCRISKQASCNGSIFGGR
ncbi:hypothetical protein Goklo_021664, partial [Gossypium klotzschianum]|nr:hypothetical protein [Gossypium klotzschianum]